MQFADNPLPERTPKACVEGRAIALLRSPDLWLAGLAVAIGLGAWIYDKHWQAGMLAGLVASPILNVIYPLPAWLFGWPQVRWMDVVGNTVDLLDMIVGLLSIFS